MARYAYDAFVTGNAGSPLPAVRIPAPARLLTLVAPKNMCRWKPRRKPQGARQPIRSDSPRTKSRPAGLVKVRKAAFKVRFRPAVRLAGPFDRG